jgi:hypothetical protein
MHAVYNVHALKDEKKIHTSRCFCLLPSFRDKRKSLVHALHALGHAHTLSSTCSHTRMPYRTYIESRRLFQTTPTLNPKQNPKLLARLHACTSEAGNYETQFHK